MDSFVGEVPVGWSRVKIADIATVVGGGTPSTRDPGNFGGAIPWLTPKDLSDHPARFTHAGSRWLTDKGLATSGARLLPAGSVLISSRAPIGLVTIAANPISTNQGFRSLVVSGEDSPEFLYYLFTSRTADLVARAHGTTFQEISGTSLKSVEVLLPPAPEQRRIAALLGALDDKIELNTRLGQTLEAIGRTLYRSWFVDFDPVRSGVETRGSPWGLEITDLFPNAFAPSKDGGVPVGWRRAGIGELAGVLSGGTPSKSDETLWDGTTPWISPKVMTEIHCDSADLFVSQAAIGNGTRMARAGATLVMVRGMGLHKKVRVSQAQTDVTFNQDVKALVPRGIEPSLLLFALLDAQEGLLHRVETSGHGTGRLPSDVLIGYPLTMPDRARQRELAVPFNLINDGIAKARRESRTLVGIRDALLPALLSGRLRTSDSPLKGGEPR